MFKAVYFYLSNNNAIMNIKYGKFIIGNYPTICFRPKSVMKFHQYLYARYMITRAYTK